MNNVLKVALLTLGCRVNQSETDVLEGTLKKNGIRVVSLDENPDYCIVNTCSVTAKGDYNSRQLIRRAARAGAKVLVTGCYSEIKADIVNSLPGVVEVVKNDRKYEIPSIIAGTSCIPFFGYQGRSRPYVKVQDGCNYRCSYCSVPLARGNSRSTPSVDAVERVRQLVEAGCKEIVLTGIHLGTYGEDLDGKTRLCDLIKEILAGTDIHRIRLSSLEVTEIDDELLELLQERRMCGHLHVPLQSGSDKVLSRMRRVYRSETYRSKVKALSERIKNLALGTDIIVGFPGEEETDFAQTYSLIEDLPFSYLHVFPFSPRPGTDAALMGAGSPDLTTRLKKLRQLHFQKKFEYMTAQINGELEIILEEELAAGVMKGTSANYLKVAVPVPLTTPGSLAVVRPERIVNGMLRAGLIAVS